MTMHRPAYLTALTTNTTIFTIHALEEDERITAHIARYNHGPIDCMILPRHSRMARRKGTGRTLAVDADTLQLPIDFVLFHLGDVVTDVVDHRHLLRASLATKDAGEGLADSIHQQLAVGPGEVGCTGHGGKIRL